MIRFADPLWFIAALLVAARVALLVRDRRERFGAFRFSSLPLIGARSTMRTGLAWPSPAAPILIVRGEPPAAPRP